MSNPMDPALRLTPITELAQARHLFAVLQAALAARGLVLRPPPPEPIGCCGRGCNGCVWEGFYAAATWWREDACELLHLTDPAMAPSPGKPA